MTLLPLTDLVVMAKADPEGFLAYCEVTPEMDELMDRDEMSAWTGLEPQSISVMVSRVDAAGRAQFPAADKRFGRSPAWRPRTVVIHYAGSDGRARVVRDS